MTPIHRASTHRFISTPALEQTAMRVLRYLQSGFSVHLRGAAGTGKTTLALHLADLLSRPRMLIFGGDELKTSELDLACREGFTVVYDRFNHACPEANFMLWTALEEKLLALPFSPDRSNSIRVHPQFRAIVTSNPEDKGEGHANHDALLDRLITLDMPEPDERTQQEIIVQRTNLDRPSAALIIELVKTFQQKTGAEKLSKLRSSLILAKVCQEHCIAVMPQNSDFQEICQDVLLAQSALPSEEASQLLESVFNESIDADVTPQERAGFNPRSRIFSLKKSPGSATPSESIDELELDPEFEAFSELLQAPQPKATLPQPQASESGQDAEAPEAIDRKPGLNPSLESSTSDLLSGSMQESLIQLLEMSESSEQGLR